MSEYDRTTDVLIVGAGPVGLAAAEMLGAAGVDALVVERTSDSPRHPRAGGIHGRTMEMFRQWGLADEVRRGALAPERSQGFGWFTTLAEDEIGSLRFADLAGPDPGGEPGPETPCFCPQPHYERVLLNGARRHPSVTVSFDRVAIAVRDLEDGVEIDVRHVGSGTVETIRSRFLIAADGAHSGLRASLNIGETGLRSFGHSVHIHFRADLTNVASDKPFMLLWIVNATTQGTLAAASQDYSEWTYNLAADPAYDYATAELEDLIRAAIGVPDLALEVLDVARWDYEQLVSDHWRRGRAFLVGDAAHRFPPHGAFGMNSGVQDAQNLAWKLALVLRGAATMDLLDTYETERKPVAEVNGQQSVHNTHTLDLASGKTLDHQQLMSLMNPGTAAAVREQLQAAIAQQAGHLQSEGQQFGVTYTSAAVAAEGREPSASTISRYVASAAPGARAPHLWLQQSDGSRLSTIDLLGRGFVLLAASAGRPWVKAAAVSGSALSARLVCHTIGDGAELVEAGSGFQDTYGLTSTGAVLVRPDGYVLARFPELIADPVGALDHALSYVLAPAATQRDLEPELS